MQYLLLRRPHSYDHYHGYLAYQEWEESTQDIRLRGVTQEELHGKCSTLGHSSTDTILEGRTEGESCVLQEESKQERYHAPHDSVSIISAREKLAICDVTNLPYMDINWQSISIYGYFVTSLIAYYSCADISDIYFFKSKTLISFFLV